MKKLYFLFFLTIGFFANAQIINFPDANFKAKLLSASVSNGIASTQTPNTNGIVSSFNTIDINGDSEIQVSEALLIKYLVVENSNITDLSGIEYFSNLIKLSVLGNQLTNVDFSFNSNFVFLNCSFNNINSLNISSLNNLKELECMYNQLSSIDLSTNSNLRILKVGNNLLTSIDLTQNLFLNTLNIQNNSLSSLDVSLNINLRNIGANNNLLTIVNLGSNDFLEILNLSTNQLSFLNVTQLPELKTLDVNNNQITSLNITQNSYLGNLYAMNNSLSSLITLQNPNLFQIELANNQISNIDLSANILLKTLSISNNNLTNLNINQNSALEFLYAYNNQISVIDVSQNIQLRELLLHGNQISNLDLNSNANLESLFCGLNLLTNLDITNNALLNNLNCSNMPMLEVLYLKNQNASAWINLNFSLNSNLEFICCDDEDLTLVNQKIIDYGYTNCYATNLNCTYPVVNELSGNIKYDYYNNGCGDTWDIPMPNVRYNVFDGTDTFTTFGNQNGNYFMPLVNGNYTITPVVEQPNYFNVSPNNVTINFPALTSPHVQDFCVTWNQIDYFDDLEVTILPMSPARPGFEAVYKVMVRNKGVDYTYGTVSLTYDSSILTYVSSNPVYTATTTNSLSWFFVDIEPFQVLEYEVRFNLNSPTASPPINNGDELHFTAQVAHEDYVEYTPDDNTFTLDQTVVGSYDPNDKVCLQGETEDVSIVGEYVHYMIRFENTGTFLAEKVVVEDFIDVSKFDIATLIPLNASHAYYTKITGNKVEFIFDNINLDFNNPNNDGFIAFKIKLLPTLVVGDTFTNSANIYFDFNPAIVTDSYTTTIVETLSNETFENNSFSIYPNPTKDILNIEFKNQAEIKSVAIYNLIGQLIISVPNVTNSIDVSSLASGTYFVKINSEKGSANAKFVKE